MAGVVQGAVGVWVKGCECARKHIRMIVYACVHVCVCVCISVCVYVCMCVYVCACVPVY